MPQIQSIPLFTIKTKATYLGVTVRNVYHYLDLAGAPTSAASAIATDFETVVLTPSVANLSDQFAMNTIEVIQENDSENFAIAASTLVGPNINNPVASNLVISVRLNRTDRLFRNGWKRWSGLTENQVDGNFIETASANAFQTDMDIQGAPVTLAGNTFTPIILRRTFSGDPPVQNPVDLWLYSLVGSAQVFRRLGTQNTRKEDIGE